MRRQRSTVINSMPTTFSLMPLSMSVEDQPEIFITTPPSYNFPEPPSLQINFNSDIIGYSRHSKDRLQPASIPRRSTTTLTTYPNSSVLEIGTLLCHKRNTGTISSSPSGCNDASQIGEVSIPRWPSSRGRDEQGVHLPRKRCYAIKWTTSNARTKYTSPTNENFQLMLSPNGEPIVNTKMQPNARNRISKRFSFP